MLNLCNISKIYQTSSTNVQALKNVSLQFRQSEFVAILGPSGCGKTTLLNIIGGLDRYTSGNLIIGGVSTADFDDEHWDAYRNATIGFVFQSYNLIPHLSVLENVELALSLSGENKKARKQKAIDVLKRVGMDEEISKRPNQLSGGQMQRVAIARAIVNNPKIILADEPTGALDSELSVQVMDVLQKISHDTLVIMVTHNDELAKRYSSRIVRFKDGQVVEDTNPYMIEESPTAFENKQEIVKKDKTDTLCLQNNEIKSNIGKFDYEINLENNTIGSVKEKRVSNRKRKSAMKNINNDSKELLDNLGVSVKKKNRKDKSFKPTSMRMGTAFSLSLKNLISKKRRTFFTTFAGSIGIIGLGLVLAIANGFDVYVDDMQSSLLAGVPLGVYEYNIDYTVMTDMINNFQPTTDDGAYPEDEKVNLIDSTASAGMIGDMMNSLLSSVSKNNVTKEFETYLRNMPSEYYSAMEVFYGTRYNMVVKTLDDDGNEIYKDVSKQPKPTSALTIATNVLGDHGQQPAVWHQLVGSQDFMLKQYDLVGANSRYPSDKTDLLLCVNENNAIDIKALAEFGFDVYQRDANGAVLKNSDGEKTLRTDITFDDIIGMKIKLLLNNDYYKSSGDWYQKTDEYSNETLNNLYDSENALTLNVCGIIRLNKKAEAAYVGNNLCYTPALAEYITANAAKSDVAQFQNELIADGYDTTDIFGSEMPIDDDLTANAEALSFMSSSLERSAYMKAIGADSTPSYMCVYPHNYGEKQKAAEYINAWNSKYGGNVTYFDASEMFVHNITTAIDLMSILLIAVASISLIVSTVMIGVITSNSVIERTREIGILRSLGARKRDIMSVFLSETAIIGLWSGIIGIVLTYALCPLGSVIVNKISEVPNFLHFHPLHALLLVVLSFVLTVISGIIPAFSASRKNVVDALRID